MRHLSIAVIAAASTIALTQFALAADMPVKARRYAPPPPPPPPISWTGWYVGLNAGYNWGGSSEFDTVATPGFVAPTWEPDVAAAAYAATTSLNPKQNGFIGGGQIGYNWQFAPIWVAGLEADIQGLANNNHTDSVTRTAFASDFLPANTYGDTISSTTTASKKVDWLGTVRARLGVLAAPSLLVYGTGGLAYGGVKATTAISQTLSCIYTCTTEPPANYSTTGSISKTRAGWTAGGGIEWLFAPQWSLRAEYLYYDLGKETFNNPDLVAVVPAQQGECTGGGTDVCYTVHSQSTVRFNGNIVRAAISYHF